VVHSLTVLAGLTEQLPGESPDELEVVGDSAEQGREAGAASRCRICSQPSRRATHAQSSLHFEAILHAAAGRDGFRQTFECLLHALGKPMANRFSWRPLVRHTVQVSSPGGIRGGLTPGRHAQHQSTKRLDKTGREPALFDLTRET
jgi:hypothetical protein